MKSLFLLTITTLLINLSGFAQIDQKEYDKLVDYVNVFYSKSYLDKKVAQGGPAISKNYRNDYLDIIEPKWEKYLNDNFDSEIIISQNDLGHHPNAVILSNFITSKKSNFKQSWNKETIIDYLIALPDSLPSKNENGFKGYLGENTKILKDILVKRLDKRGSQKNGKEGASTIATSGLQNSEAQDTTLQNKDKRRAGHKTRNTEYEIPYSKIGFIIFFAVAIYFIVKRRNAIQNFFSKNLKIKSNEKGDYSLADLKIKVKELQLENIRLKDFEQNNAHLHLRNKQLEQRVRELERQLETFKNDLENEETQNALYTSSFPEEKPFSSHHLYAEAIVDGAFYGIIEKPNEDTVYELTFSSNSRFANFRIYSEAYKRVIKNPDFVDGCDKQKINSQPQVLEVEEGDASQDDFGKWKVSKRAIVKFK